MNLIRYFRKPTHRPPIEEVFEQPAPKATVSAISITMVKNEQDIVEPFLRTNRPYLDAMILMDNGSTDGTREIAMNCARELGGIFVVDSPDINYAQEDHVTAAVRYVQSAFFADHLVFLDCDEFLTAKSPEAFRAALAAEPPGTVTLHAWRTFLPDPVGTVSSEPLDAIRFVRRSELPPYKKVIWHLSGGFSASMHVEKGAHGVTHGKESLPAADRDDFPLVHVPVRSADQIVAKALIGWHSLILQHPDLRDVGSDYEGASFHRKRLIDQVREKGPALRPEDVADIAVSYAQKAKTVAFNENAIAEQPSINLTRRFSDGRAMPPEQALFKQSMGLRPVDYSRLLDRPSRPISSRDEVSETVFSEDWHWSKVFLDVAPFRFLAEYLQPRTVLDIGCGKDAYLKLFQSLGASEILGTDGVDLATTVLGDDQYIRHDLHLPLDLGKTFDLVLCLEVVEHLDPAATALAFDSIARHARDRIVFFVAEPGQPGHGHINCITMDRALDLWSERGWVPDLVETLGLRAVSTMSWFRRNLLVLRPVAAFRDETSSASLRSIAAMTYRWYGQDTGIRPTPFCERYPPGIQAYGRVRHREG